MFVCFHASAARSAPAKPPNELLWMVEDLVEHVAADEAAHQHPGRERSQLHHVKPQAARAPFGENDTDDDAGRDEEPEGMNRERSNLDIADLDVGEHDVHHALLHEASRRRAAFQPRWPRSVAQI
jgi:hypothetical protein